MWRLLIGQAPSVGQDSSEMAGEKDEMPSYRRNGHYFANQEYTVWIYWLYETTRLTRIFMGEMYFDLLLHKTDNCEFSITIS